MARTEVIGRYPRQRAPHPATMSQPPLIHPRLTALALGALLAVAAPSAAAAPGKTGLKLHVPSPDWRDQVIYLLMTDRFDDGNPANNDQGAGEFKPGSGAHWQGGDLAGVTRRLSYIKGLGATAVWITPPVANQWWNGGIQFGGYHGYWAEHFTQVDKHLGNLADYQRLSHELHSAGMYLVQDVVLNHTGDYFHYAGPWQANDPAKHWTATPDSRPSPRPKQWPFSQNDPRDPAQRQASIYHWTPDVVDYGQREQVLNWQMAGLDDLNTDNPVVKRALRQSYAHWIREVGVDAFRVDTAFYVPPSLFTDFLHARDAKAPGINQVARQTGRRDFFVFGEGFGIDRPGERAESDRIEQYMGRTRMGGMLNFPLYGAMMDAFARGRPTAELGQRIMQMQQIHPRLHWMPSFIDNHDVDRFLAGGQVRGLEQALLAMMTLPGIPTLYYGTEQGFVDQRASMFAAGVGSEGRDHFNTQAPLYRRVAELTGLRHANRLFSRGRPTVLAGQALGPGALAWRTDHAGQSALVVVNTADQPMLLDRLPTGLKPGAVLRGLYGLDGTPDALKVGTEGQVTLELPARAGLVWLAERGAAGQHTKPTTKLPAAVSPSSAPTLNAVPPVLAQEQTLLSGQSDPRLGAVQVVLDGQLASAVSAMPDAQGHWQALLDTSGLADPAAQHRVVVWRPADRQTSAPAGFRIQRDWQVRARVNDAAGDDRGPAGRYVMPTDPLYAQGAMDIREVTAAVAGKALQVQVELGAHSTLWNPPNGFDHLALTLFIELPGEPGGARVMPLQNATLPGDMRWHRRLRVHGWSNALFGPEGASAQNEGRSITPSAGLSVDAARKRITFTLPASALGAATLSGARLYLNSWDWDGGYRPVLATPGGQNLGGGAPGDALIADDTAILTLP